MATLLAYHEGVGTVLELEHKNVMNPNDLPNSL